jgi:predicted patatin/cPLA2 family phospholipase
MTAPKATGARPARPAPPNIPDQKTISAGERPETASPSSTGRKPWKKKTVAEQILGQLDKLRADVAEKERDYLQAKKQLDKLEELRAVLENQ